MLSKLVSCLLIYHLQSVDQTTQQQLACIHREDGMQPQYQLCLCAEYELWKIKHTR